MADILTKTERSIRMSLIRAKWTKPEITIHNYLKGNGIRHTIHPHIQENPDIILKDVKVAIFINGCFWHGCPTHYKKPFNNQAFWAKKIKTNKIRDKRAESSLKKKGWRVIVLWEHDILPNQSNKVRLPLSSIPHSVPKALRRSPSG